MKTPEALPVVLDFGLEGFNIDAAFQGAMSDIASDAKLALDEKVRRMETVIAQGASDVYRDFVDFRQLAAQVEFFCAHDHALNQAVGSSELIGAFTSDHGDDSHQHDKGKHHHDDDEYEIDPKTGKRIRKKKKKIGMFGVLHLL